MKKTLFVLSLTVVLVLALAATAMAATGLPDRSSAFLKGATGAYITWGAASRRVPWRHYDCLVRYRRRFDRHADAARRLPDDDRQVQVCHSRTGSHRRREAACDDRANACAYCHLGATAQPSPRSLRATATVVPPVHQRLLPQLVPHGA